MQSAIPRAQLHHHVHHATLQPKVCSFTGAHVAGQSRASRNLSVSLPQLGKLPMVRYTVSLCSSFVVYVFFLTSCFSKAYSLIDFEHGIDRVIVNIGCFEDPPTPFNSTAVIAFEARHDSASVIPFVPNRYVVSAAVSTVFDIVPIFQYGPTSSMLRPQQPNRKQHSLQYRRWLRKLMEAWRSSL